MRERGPDPGVSCELTNLLAKYKANKFHEAELMEAIAATSSRIDEQSRRIIGLQAELDGLGRTTQALEDADGSPIANLWQALFTVQQAVSDFDPEVVVLVRHGLAVAWRALSALQALLQEADHNSRRWRERAAAAEDLVAVCSSARNAGRFEHDLKIALPPNPEQKAQLEPELFLSPAEDDDVCPAERDAVEWERRPSDADLLAAKDVSFPATPGRPTSRKRPNSSQAGSPTWWTVSTFSSPSTSAGMPSPEVPAGCPVFSLCSHESRAEVAIACQSSWGSGAFGNVGHAGSSRPRDKDM